ncbi:hypothetical protein BYT27DRAFT_7256767 [Phlegmacium glaucopus]|nr:hypothetical protein BYT27DRAFT_7256767 [Phlegmacium glaucopus]
MGDHVIKSDDPVFLEDFYITPEQCGLAPPHCNNLMEEQAFVFEDYATSQAFKNLKKHEHFQQCSNNQFDPLAVQAIQELDEANPLVDISSAT